MYCAYDFTKTFKRVTKMLLHRVSLMPFIKQTSKYLYSIGLMFFCFFFFFIIEPPDLPEKIILEVTGNNSVKISCIEADNPESSICTKFKGE